MKRECDKCGKPATVHLTEIANGQKIEKHLCEDCAAAEGITVKASLPISQLLEDFVLQSSGHEDTSDLRCDVCGLTFPEFRQRGVLGCPNDYDAFSEALDPMLRQAQEGADQHIGKVPKRADSGQEKQNTMLRLRGELKQAIASENYERAAELRDRLKEMEQ